MIKVAPSILAADFSKLGEEVNKVTMAGADYLHIDIMDGHFVPNISLGPAIVKSIRNYTDLKFDVHLMINNPDKYIDAFVEAGADIITVHVEACPHLYRTIEHIKSYGCKVGVVINPHSPVALIENVLDNIDWVLVMTVNPGFGGQKFIKSVLKKIELLDELRTEKNYKYKIQVDGGINKETARLCENVGADCLVAGSAIFNSDNYEKAILEIRG